MPHFLNREKIRRNCFNFPIKHSIRLLNSAKLFPRRTQAGLRKGQNRRGSMRSMMDLFRVCSFGESRRNAGRQLRSAVATTDRHRLLERNLYFESPAVAVMISGAVRLKSMHRKMDLPFLGSITALITWTTRLTGILIPVRNVSMVGEKWRPQLTQQIFRPVQLPSLLFCYLLLYHTEKIYSGRYSKIIVKVGF